ncbi:hypothetical protein ACVWYF_004286 [Hymenobacter sp. UYAg731]
MKRPRFLRNGAFFVSAGVPMPDGGVIISGVGVRNPDNGVIIPEAGVRNPGVGVIMPGVGVIILGSAVFLPEGGHYLVDVRLREAVELVHQPVEAALGLRELALKLLLLGGHRGGGPLLVQLG